jgi:peptidoglycan/LPS O-acetylase OafA/YrhL
VLPKELNQVLFWSGYYAVITFFVISGFLISSLSLRRWGRLGNVATERFYAMRIARIVPCLLLLLVILVGLHWSGAADFTIKPERASLGRVLVAAATFHINWLEGHHGYLPGGWDVLWSLSIEETFYLLFPLVCVLLRSERLLLLPLLGLIIAGPVSRALLADQDPWGDYAYFSCMDGIAFGCVAALICARLRPSRRILRIASTIGASLALTVLVFCNEDEHVGLARWGLNITALEAGIAMVLVALASGVGNGTLSKGTQWLRAVGQSSYEIYLFHMLILLGLMDLYKSMLPARVTIPIWYFGMLLLSVLVGYAVSRFYSEPLNRRLRVRGLGRRDETLVAAPKTSD